MVRHFKGNFFSFLLYLHQSGEVTRWRRRRAHTQYLGIFFSIISLLSLRKLNRWTICDPFSPEKRAKRYFRNASSLSDGNYGARDLAGWKRSEEGRRRRKSNDPSSCVVVVGRSDGMTWPSTIICVIFGTKVHHETKNCSRLFAFLNCLK